MKIKLGLIRGVCQLPAYIAMEKGYLDDKGFDYDYKIDPTAWLVPDQLVKGELTFSIMPWTRTVSARDEGNDLLVIGGSGYEETAVVVNKESDIQNLDDLNGKKISLPAVGGMKDITSQKLFEDYGISSDETEVYRMPSGDAAVLSFLSGEVDATTNVEPFSTLAVELGVGEIIARGGDILPKSPGCSVTASEEFVKNNEEEVVDFLDALKKANEFIYDNPKEAAELSSKYIGINGKVTRKALKSNKPKLDIRDSIEAMDSVIEEMIELGYVNNKPEKFYDFSYLEKVL
ncbi:hypothetical protein C9439_01280 [archaeon SCG-AAA382B04]|nr:hypothetical protein C9439_01280 [archaeon SCG-AAA382B04]